MKRESFLVSSDQFQVKSARKVKIESYYLLSEYNQVIQKIMNVT